jgi:hypothetical protein
VYRLEHIAEIADAKLWLKTAQDHPEIKKQDMKHALSAQNIRRNMLRREKPVLKRWQLLQPPP